MDSMNDQFALTIHMQQESHLWGGRGGAPSTTGRMTFTIVGIYENASLGVVMNASQFNQMFMVQGYLYGVLAVLPTSNSELRSFLRFSHERNNGIEFSVISKVSHNVNFFGELFEQLAPVMLYIGIGFSIFAALMLLQFIAISVSYKKKEIGILRAIGARSGDVFKIFLNESLVITIVNVILASIAVLIICMIINSAAIGSILGISILNFTFRQVMLITAVGLATAFIGTFLPVYKTARKKPVEAMRKGEK